LRTPLLPAATLARFAAEGEAQGAASAPSDAEYARARERERTVVRAVIARADVREALFLASPSLVDSLEAWQTSPDSPQGQASEAALVRYVQRMSARPTPFGLFAGITVGTTGDRTALVLGPAAGYRRHTRLDNDYLEQLTETLAADPALRARLAFEPNTSIYSAGDRLRFIEARHSEQGRAYVLTAVDASPAVAAAVAAARGGRTLAELAAAVVRDDPEIELDDALAFVDDLVDAGLLVATLAPNVTGAEPIHGIVRELGDHPAARALGAAQALLEVLDARGVGQPSEAYRAIETTLRAGATVDGPPRFQVDLGKPGQDVILGGDVLAEVSRAVALVARLDLGAGRSVAASFARAFTQRFEGEEVPLALALDPELGVGLGDGAHDDPTSVLAGQPFTAATPPAGEWFTRDAALLDMLGTTLSAGRRELQLDERCCRALEVPSRRRLPPSFCAVAMIHAASAAALDQGDLQVEFLGFHGPSGANAFGRFCHGDRELAARVEGHLRAEEAERPDAIFAELVHLPVGRIGNVIARPVMRDHEIVFLGRSGAPADRQILLDDLLVSVRDGRVTLRSRRHGREVIPRLTCAHAVRLPHNASAYRLLGELAGQGIDAGFGWSWGALATAPFLPRVTSGRIVLALATWRLTGEQVAGLVEPEPRAARLRALARLRADLALPRHLALVENDLVLPIDLDSVLSAEAFLHAVRGKRSVKLVEQLGAHTGPAEGPEGGFRAEIQVPFRPARAPDDVGSARAVGTGAAASATIADEARVRRVFPPGSDWLYLQLHAGISTIDRALVRLAPVISEQHARGHIDRWFFVRYDDPGWHLRLRLHGAPDALWSQARRALQPTLDELVAEGGVHRVAHDTYRREIERYGGAAAIAIAEQWFHVDSTFVAACVAALVGDEHAPERFRLALTTTEWLLTALVPDLGERHAMIEQTRDALVASELGRDVAVSRWLGGYARREREMLASVGEFEAAADSPLAALHAHADAYRPAVAALADELRALERTRRLTVRMTELAQSLVHMHVNRLLRGEHRRQEAVIYDLLGRVYRGRAARRRGGAP